MAATDTVDVVNKPQHYRDHEVFSGECLQYTSNMGFLGGNAFKYCWRHRYKGKPLEDLDKAIFYVKWRTSNTTGDRRRFSNTLTSEDRNRLYQEWVTFRQEHPERVTDSLANVTYAMIALAAGLRECEDLDEYLGRILLYLTRARAQAERELNNEQ